MKNPPDSVATVDRSDLSAPSSTSSPAPYDSRARFELGRSLQARHVTLISLGGVIGAGLFVGMSASIAAAGPAIVISYLAAGILLFLVMRMLGEMALARPDIRAFTDFIRAGLGPGAGFAVAWMYWYLWAVMLAVEAIAGATLLHRWIPLPTWQVGLGLLLVMTGINLMSTRAFGEFEFWFASIKVAAIVIFIALAAGYASGVLGSAAPTWRNLVDHGGFMPRGSWAIAAGVTTVFFSLSGTEIATIAAAESKEPSAAVARITRTLVWRILVFYTGSVLLIVAVVPWTSIVPGISPFTTALEAMGFSWAGTVINLVILSAILSALNSGFYISSRVLFTLATHRDAPVWLVALNRRRVPARAILFGSLVGTAGVVAAAFAPSKIFSFLVNASGALILVVYLMVCLAYLRIHRTGLATEKTIEGRWRLRPFPGATVMTMAGIVAVLIAMATTPELSSQFYASTVPLAIVSASYWAVKRSRR